MRNKYIILFLLFVTSCNNDINNKILGLWIIDEIKYDNEDVRLYFGGQGLIIERDSCILPVLNGRNEKSGKWKCFKKNGKFYLKIDTRHPFFNDTYEILNLFKDCNDSGGCLMRLELQSDSTYIRCSQSVYYTDFRPC